MWGLGLGAVLSRGDATSSAAERSSCRHNHRDHSLSLAAARDQAQEEYRAAVEQAVSIRQQAAVRACISALSDRGQGWSGMSGGLTLSVGL